MNNVFILNKETYEVIQEKVFQKNPNAFNAKDLNQNLFSDTIDLIKDLDLLNSNDYYILKLDNRNIIYRKSKELKLAILIISSKRALKRNSLLEVSKVYLQCIEQNMTTNSENLSLSKKNQIEFKAKEYTIKAIEELTIKFIENLRKNKLYAKFIYYNYNPNVMSSICYKKTKLESTSVILFNSNKDYDKM
jgi:hypothetical protein